MQSTLDRLVQKILAAHVDPQPSENIYMQEVFSPEVYSELLARLPGDDKYEFIEHPDAVLPDGRKTRRLLDLTEQTIKHFNPNDQPFWLQMKDVLTSIELQQAILQIFKNRINERFGTNWPEMVTVPIFYRDYPGYHISIHTDAPYKIATMQFYFPKDNSQIHLGTSFHQRNNNAFYLLKTNQFKPNSAYAFVRTDNSWHSVRRIGDHETIRDSLALTIYVKGSEYKSTKNYM